MKIIFDAPGKIISGEELGRYVKLLDDTQISGGYLILTAASLDMRDDGFDNWVGSMEDLRRYFKEANWIVEWVGQ